MKSILFTLLCSFSFLTGYTQYFEGRIIYSNHTKTKNANISDQQLNSMLGTKNEYSIKSGDYKSVTNGTAFSEQIYQNAVNNLYFKKPDVDTFYWSSGLINSDTLLSYKVVKNTDTILGFKCDELIIESKSGTTHYYYSNNLPLNVSKYKEHHYNNWDLFVSKAGQLPLKIVIDNNYFHMESTATEIKPMKLNDAEFKISGPVKKFD